MPSLSSALPVCPRSGRIMDRPPCPLWPADLHKPGGPADTLAMSNTITTPNSELVGPVARKRPRLRLLYSPTDGVVKNRAFSLPVGRTFIGRELPADHEGISIAGDPGMSSVHALIEVSANDYHVRISDCRSKNGTFVGRSRVPGSTTEWSPIPDGSIVRVGSSCFLLRSEPTQVADADIPSLVGVSLAMCELRARIARVAPEPVQVLLLGETGTGKEVVARALHKLSRRAGELVAMNCAAIPDSLAESELFGHTERSFTGAHARQGAFRRADRGTLFLDEIGDMPLELQAKLLRVLEEHVVTPVGSDRPLPLDVRIVAATHHDLEADVGAGAFRSDLHARLAHIQIELPPLRSRRDDILLLLEHASPESTRALTPDLVHDLLSYDWPQNVREVRSIAERLRIDGVTEALRERLRGRRAPSSVHVQAADEELTAARPPLLAEPHRSPRAYRLQVPTKERLIELLRQHQGVVQYVAEDLDCSRRQVRRWIDVHGLDPEQFRSEAGG